MLSLYQSTNHCDLTIHVVAVTTFFVAMASFFVAMVDALPSRLVCIVAAFSGSTCKEIVNNYPYEPNVKRNCRMTAIINLVVPVRAASFLIHPGSETFPYEK